MIVDNSSISNKMKSNFLPIYANAAKLRASGNAYIVESLEKAGLKGIVPSHGDVLRHLFNKGPCNMGELARSVKRTKSTMTVLIDKLEKEGYVQKSPDPVDSRGVLVELTEKGTALEPVFEQISQGLFEKLTSKLTNQELETLNRLLQKCVE